MEKLFFITVLNCDNVQIHHTYELPMKEGSTIDDAEQHFKNMITGLPTRILILSVYDEDEIIRLIDNGMSIPHEIERHFNGVEPYSESNEDENLGHENDEDEDETYGDEWKKLLH